MKINDKVIQALKEHASECANSTHGAHECCGLVVVVKGRQKYVPCNNVAADRRNRFAISPEDFAGAEDSGEIVAIAHSHLHASAEPSQVDLAGCEESKLPWIIVSTVTGDVKTVEPSGHQEPLVGRQFAHGVFDCFSLARDYYQQELGIAIPDSPRDERWWDLGQNIILERYESFGFVEVSDKPMEVNDVLVMQLGSERSNHLAVYIGDGLILHHVTDRLSSRDVYGGFWRTCTTHRLRYGGGK